MTGSGAALRTSGPLGLWAAGQKGWKRDLGSAVWLEAEGRRELAAAKRLRDGAELTAAVVIEVKTGGRWL